MKSFEEERAQILDCGPDRLEARDERPAPQPLGPPVNDPKSRLASLDHAANVSGLVLGCIKADFCKQIIVRHFLLSLLYD